MNKSRRKESTIVRHDIVHAVHKKILDELGQYKNVVSKNYIYEAIREKTRLSTRTIAYVLNHTEQSVSDNLL